MSDTPIYLDYQATTPVDARVMAAMVPWFDEFFGNAASIQHAHGQEAEAAVEAARAQIAALINADPREIVFTSGATESNNLAVKGVTRFALRHGTAGGAAHIIACATEHKCVLESIAAMEEEGARVTMLPVAADGQIDLGDLEAAFADDTVLVTLMAANNEIGVLHPIAEIGKRCRERGVYFHTDGAQAVGKIPIDVEAAQIDLLSVSGHKVYGPKGIGFLYVRRRPRVRLEPLFSGGGQERGLRSGTLPVPLCVGLGAACAVAAEDLARDAEHAARLRDRFRDAVQRGLPDAIVNGALAPRLPGNLNMSFPGVDGAALLESLTKISVSSGSACNSADVEPSYVLTALGVEKALAAATIRLCIGRATTADDIDSAAAHVIETVRRLRRAGAPPMAAE